MDSASKLSKIQSIVNSDTEKIKHPGWRPNQSNNNKYSVSRDSTIVSNSSTAIIDGQTSDKVDMNNDDDITFKPQSHTTIHKEKEDGNINRTMTAQYIIKQDDSDAEISPTFLSADSVKQNPQIQKQFLDCKKGYRYENRYGTVLNKPTQPAERMAYGVRKRNMNQLRKQLGDPLPLPYTHQGANKKITKDTLPASNYNSRKYSTSKTKQLIIKSEDDYMLKPLTMERLEEKRKIMANRWKDLLMKDKVRVEEKLKQLKSWDNNNSNSLTHRRHYSFPSDESGLVDLKIHSREHSYVSSIDNNEVNQLDGLDNKSLSGLSSHSVVKLQKDITTNSEKLDLIISLLQNQTDGINNSTPDNNKIMIKKKETSSFTSSQISFEIIIWTICIIILAICNVYVLYCM